MGWDEPSEEFVLSSPCPSSHSFPSPAPGPVAEEQWVTQQQAAGGRENHLLPLPTGPFPLVTQPSLKLFSFVISNGSCHSFSLFMFPNLERLPGTFPQNKVLAGGSSPFMRSRLRAGCPGEPRRGLDACTGSPSGAHRARGGEYLAKETTPREVVQRPGGWADTRMTASYPTALLLAPTWCTGVSP